MLTEFQWMDRQDWDRIKERLLPPSGPRSSAVRLTSGTSRQVAVDKKSDLREILSAEIPHQELAKRVVELTIRVGELEQMVGQVGEVAAQQMESLARLERVVAELERELSNSDV